MTAALGELRRPVLPLPERKPETRTTAPVGNVDTTTLPRGRSHASSWPTGRVAKVIGAVGVKLTILTGCADAPASPPPPLAEATAQTPTPIVTVTAENPVVRPPQLPPSKSTEAQQQLSAPEGYLGEKSQTSLVDAANKTLNRFKTPKTTTDFPDQPPTNNPNTKFEIEVNDGNVVVDGGHKYKFYKITLVKQTPDQGNPNDAIAVSIVGEYRQVPYSYDPDYYGDSTFTNITLTKVGNHFAIVDSGKAYNNTLPQDNSDYAKSLTAFNAKIVDALG